MPLLDAILAFVLTMLALASIITLVTEMCNRIFRLRSLGLKLLIEHFYADVIYPGIRQSLREFDSSDFKEKCIEKCVTNPIKIGGFQGRLIQLLGIRRLTNLPTEDLIQRLADTSAGKELRAKGKEEYDQFMEWVGEQYEHYGKVASDIFSRWAQVMSLLIGSIIALACNIDAFLIFEAYMDDPQLR